MYLLPETELDDTIVTPKDCTRMHTICMPTTSHLYQTLTSQGRRKGSFNVYIQQARGLLTSCDQGTYLLWSVDVVIVNILAIGLL